MFDWLSFRQKDSDFISFFCVHQSQRIMSNVTTSETFVDDVSVSAGGDILYMIVSAIIAVLTIVGNIGTILAFWKVSALREKPSDLLILCLTCADLGVGIIGVYDFPRRVLGYWPYGLIGCQARAMLRDTCLTVGIVSTAAISYDRFLLVSREYPKYMKTQSKSRILCKIAGAWIYGIALGLSEVILWSYISPPDGLEFDYDVECRNPVKHNALCSLIYYILVIFMPLVLVEVFSLLFVHRLNRKLRGVIAIQPGDLSQTDDTPEEGENNRQLSTSADSSIRNGPNQGGSSPPRKRYMKAAIVLGALVTVLNICLLPFVLYTLAISLFCPRCNSLIVRDVLANLIYLNSCLNPVMYAVTMRKIRVFYKGVLCMR